MYVAIGRHVAGALTAWLVFTAEALVGCLALLGYALVTGADPGGPLAGPMLLVIAALLGAALMPLLFAPAVLLGEAAGRRRTPLVGALTGTAVAMLLAALYAAGVGLATDGSPAGVVLACVLAALAVVCPVLAYTLTIRAGRWAERVLGRRMLRSAPAAPVTGESVTS
ncbi:hypothetical protein ACIBXA_24285 [Micromonospora echinaurantiaca]|uniref:hypothetical protein n=1 Tax=Micromonospora echinaurantiaca TaxID=47857 RepID=UPI00378E6ABF